MAVPSAVMDELTAFERRLGRDARTRTAVPADAGLAAIFERVAQRRAGRSVPGRRDAHQPAGPQVGSEAPVRPGGAGAPDRPAGTGGPAGAVWTVEEVAPDVRILRTARPPGLRFRAGQYLKLGVPGARSGSFSIASAPHEPHLEFCVELIPGGRLTPALFALGPGDAVAVPSRAKGGFTLDGSASCHLMVATVTGIAPLRSMLRDALHRGVDAEFVVLHGASYADELPYHDELEALARQDPRVTYRPTVSRPADARNRGWTGDVGRVDDLARVVAGGLEASGTHVYACGNAGMVDRVRSGLGGSGFPVSTETYD
jgi:ferredoxin-NADP reductase